MLFSYLVRTVLWIMNHYLAIENMANGLMMSARTPETEKLRLDVLQEEAEHHTSFTRLNTLIHHV